jgi:hypothetical protein
MEFWDICAKAGVKRNWGEKKEDIYEDLKRFEAIMKWVKENAPEYYMDWKPMNHPQFGEVLIGGFNCKFTQQNPPEKFLLEELEQYLFYQQSLHLELDVLNVQKSSVSISHQVSL